MSHNLNYISVGNCLFKSESVEQMWRWEFAAKCMNIFFLMPRSVFFWTGRKLTGRARGMWLIKSSRVCSGAGQTVCVCVFGVEDPSLTLHRRWVLSFKAHAFRTRMEIEMWLIVNENSWRCIDMRAHVETWIHRRWLLHFLISDVWAVQSERWMNTGHTHTHTEVGVLSMDQEREENDLHQTSSLTNWTLFNLGNLSHSCHVVITVSAADLLCNQRAKFHSTVNSWKSRQWWWTSTPVPLYPTVNV